MSSGDEYATGWCIHYILARQRIFLRRKTLFLVSANARYHIMFSIPYTHDRRTRMSHGREEIFFHVALVFSSCLEKKT